MLSLLQEYCALLQLYEGRGIKIECMKRVDGNKKRFIWTENGEDDKGIIMKMKF